MRRLLPALLLLATAGPAAAHHMEDGATPTGVMGGLISGLAHPLIGVDHLAFLVVVGVVTGLAGRSLLLPALFVGASALGVGLHVAAFTLPGVEALVAGSVLVSGLLLARGQALPGGAWGVIFALAGLLHGYAYGEAVAGAEATPIAAYLVGLALVQGAMTLALARLVAGLRDAPVLPRLAGAAAFGVGIAMLAGILIPAG